MRNHGDRFDRSFDDAEPARLTALLQEALAGEPPLLDLVPEALAGARRRQHRERVAIAVAPVLVIAVGIAGYALVPHRSGGSGAVAPGSTRTPGFTGTSDRGPSSAPAYAPQCQAVKPQLSPNVIPASDAQAEYLCDLTFDVLAVVFPDADLRFPVGEAARWGEVNTIDIGTPDGSATLSIEYVWPATDKGEYPEVTDMACPVPDQAGCVETSPARDLRGRLDGAGTTQPSYMLNDLHGGRYIISISPQQDGDGQNGYRAPYTPDQFYKALTAPVFGAYLREYADYVLVNSPMKWPEGATYKGRLG